MASSSAAAAPRRRAVSPAPSPTGPATDVHPVLRRTTAPPAALDLLAKAHAGLDEAAVLDVPNERYATAHLAALRTAAAVLAARGRPETPAAAGSGSAAPGRSSRTSRRNWPSGAPCSPPEPRAGPCGGGHTRRGHQP